MKTAKRSATWDQTWQPGIEISETPIRKVVGRSSSNNNGWHRTSKHPVGFIAAESRPELVLFLMLAEIDPNVSVIASQPTLIKFPFQGKLTRHFPDFAILCRGVSMLCEIKTAQKYRDPAIRARLAAAAKSIEARGWQYAVLLDTDMKSEPRFKNAQDLWRWQRPIYTAHQLLAVTSSVVQSPRPIADIVAELRVMGEQAPTVQTVLSLAANGKIFIDLDAPISADSMVRSATDHNLPDLLLPFRHPADNVATRELEIQELGV